MWASDWPVLERNGSYDDWLGAARELVRSTGVDAVFGQMARRFYRF